MPLSLRLFGSLEITINGQPMPRQERRAGERLLALLALRSDRAVPRKALSGLLWPDSDEDRAQFYLRRTLSELRKALGEASTALIAPDSRSLALDPSLLECDVRRFDSALGIRDFPTAVGLYRGPLLEGWDDEWLLLERTTREQNFLLALEETAVSARSSREAIAGLRKIVAIEPGRESAWRALLESMAAAGDAGALVSAYRELRLYLRREARIDPSPETRACFERLRAEMRRRARARAPQESTPPALPATLPASRLPQPRTPLIGRVQERRRVAEILREERVVTLVGIGGVGKTRLALAVLQDRETERPKTVWWVDLSATTEPGLVAARVAEALGVPEEALPEALEEPGMLLALDNCEQVLDGAAHLADTLLMSCPSLQLLCTSREPLGLAGEVIFSVPTLSGGESVALFLDRARRVRPDWSVTEKTAPTVAAICRRLDDIALAIELATALLAVMTVEEIDARLDQRFDILRFGPRTLSARQQTLQAAMDWSWELLGERERQLLARLSVFAGGARLEAIEAVSPAGGNLLQELHALVSKSLVVHEPVAGRYRLLETVREYATAQCSPDEREKALGCHARYFATLSEKTARQRVGPTAGAALETLEADHDNLRAALDGAIQTDPALALRLGAALWPFWRERGYRTEGRRRLTEALAAAGDTPERPRALLGLGALCYELDDYDAAHVALSEAQALARAGEDIGCEAEARRLEGLVLWNQGEHVRARQCYESARTLFTQAGDLAGIAATLASLAHLHWNLGALDHATQFNEESQALWRQLGDEAGIAETATNLGLIARARGDYAVARRYMDEALQIRQRLDLRAGIASLTHHLGVIALLEGNLDEAQERLTESISRWRELHDPSWQALSLNYLGIVRRDQGDLVEAERLLSEALEIRRRTPSLRAVAGLLFALGDISLRQDRNAEAAARFLESARLRRELGLDGACGESLCGLAAALTRLGDHARAGESLAAVERLAPETLSEAGKNLRLEALSRLSSTGLPSLPGEILIERVFFPLSNNLPVDL